MLSKDIFSKTAIIIPTYNEKENIRKLIQTIFGISENMSIIVVDDNSPDKTGEIVDALTKKYENLKIIHRIKKNGRGGACIEGFKWALAKGVSHSRNSLSDGARNALRPSAEGFEYIFEMDADFSHDPADIPCLLTKVLEGNDMVIGSRYLRDSKILNWGLKRTIFSKFANIYARIILGIPIRDYTNGYRCYTRKTMESMDFDRIEASGYIVLSEMSYQLHKKHFKIGEIPITFVNRKRGISNLSIHEITSAFTSVLSLKWDYMKNHTN